MRSLAPLACVVATAMTLAGCAHRKPPPPSLPAQTAPQPQAAVTVDGSYSGPSRLIMADGRNCPRSTMVDATVFDRGFDVPYREGPGRLQPIHATIAPDGSINGGDGIVNIAGKLEGGDVLNLTVANDRCQSHVVLRRH